MNVFPYKTPREKLDLHIDVLLGLPNPSAIIKTNVLGVSSHHNPHNNKHVDDVLLHAI